MTSLLTARRWWLMGLVLALTLAAAGTPMMASANSFVMVLTPGTATNEVGQDHTVIATFTVDERPVADQPGSFTVSGANSGATGVCDPSDCITDSNGQVSFTYTGEAVGTDSIVACVGGDAAVPLLCAEVVKVWTEIEVPVDVKPQSCPNPVNVKGRGVLSVAILGTDSLDVNDIDVGTVELEGVSPLRSEVEDVATPFVGTISSPRDRNECTEAGLDGNDDLTLKFDTEAIVAALDSVSDGDVLVLTLTGNLLNGRAITGEDVVVIVKKGHGH